MRLFPLRPALLVRVLQAVATIGLLAALVGTVVGWGLLGQAQAALEDSLTLTSDTLMALDASAGVAADSIETLGTSLAALEETATSLDAAFDDGEVLMDDLAELVRRDIADSLTAVDDALPGLIRVAGTIDTTLSALSNLPFGPAYDPAESFADALRTLDVSLDGLPDRLREQADQIDATASSLGDVGDGVSDLASDLAGFDATLADTSELLDTYATTIEAGTALVEETTDQLGRQLVFGRIAVVLLGVAFALLQVVPLQMAAVAAAGMRATDGAARPVAGGAGDRAH
ncbi:hypothetical protein [Euzebya rosea]|uniref:hypothetical protein n=1 Tax=Euzebya rosea TaxID=2052804 RepID=UPI001300BE46|nr:hypothetical protein [Euzebya rosea]